MSSLRQFKSELLKALAHPIRIHIIDLLRHGERSVGDLQNKLEIEGPNTSQQLSILRNKSLVATRKEGNTVYYSVKDPKVFELLDIMKQIFDNHLIELQSHSETTKRIILNLFFPLFHSIPLLESIRNLGQWY